MKTRSKILTAIAAAAAVTVFWWASSHRPPEGGGEPEPEPTASVVMAPLYRGIIERQLVAYGTVIAPMAATHEMTLPFESRIISVSVTPGQRVAAGGELLRVERTKDAQAALSAARNTAAASSQALQETQHRFEARLATNQDLLAAQSAAEDARIKLESLEGAAWAADGIVRAPLAGTITKVAAQPGASVPSGGALVEIASNAALEVRLGIAPADARQVRAGQEVHLFPVESGSGVELAGKVREIGESIDPATRLVDAFVALRATTQDSSAALIGSFVRAGVVTEKKTALLAPRAAVLPQAGESTADIFTVKNGHAVKYRVQTGLDDGEQVEISSSNPPLDAGVKVVTVGANELEEGMAVSEVTKPGEEP